MSSIIDDINSLNIQNKFLLLSFDVISMFPSLDKIFSLGAFEDVLEKNWKRHHPHYVLLKL